MTTLDEEALEQSNNEFLLSKYAFIDVLMHAIPDGSVWILAQVYDQDVFKGKGIDDLILSKQEWPQLNKEDMFSYPDMCISIRDALILVMEDDNEIFFNVPFHAIAFNGELLVWCVDSLVNMSILRSVFSKLPQDLQQKYAHKNVFYLCDQQ